MLIPPVPRGHGGRVGPQAAAIASGGFLRGFELRIVRVLAVPPGQTLTNQVDIHVGVAHEHAPQGPAVAVLAGGLDLDRLAEHQPAQFLLGLVGLRLATSLTVLIVGEERKPKLVASYGNTKVAKFASRGKCKRGRG